MRKKVRRILAFLLALAVAMSVMTGMALSAPAESEPEATPAAADVAVEEKQTDATDSTNQAEPAEDADKDAPAEEDSSEDGEAPVEGDPEEPAPDSKKPADEAGEAASVSAASEQIATVGSGDRAVTVRTSAAAGVLPEGAKLVVKQLANTDSQYQDAANTLDANQVAYDNFLALDVGFEVNGQEVEPNGSVDVQFELGAGLLPEEADTESLAIQHLADSGKVETVADTGSATNGTVAVQEQKINAEFTVDSFSYFTITYYNSGSSIRAYCVDADGNHIPGANNVKLSDADQTIRDGNWHDISEYAPPIAGYSYSNAHLNSFSGSTITYIRYRYRYSQWYYYYSDRNSTPSNNINGTSFDGDIYLVYAEDPYADPAYTEADKWALETYGETVEFKVYRLYENTVPANIDQSFDADLFGPKGNNSPYFTVSVNLKKLLKLPNMNVTQSDAHMYISLSSCAVDGVNMDINIFWNNVLQCMSDGDIQKFVDWFGTKDAFQGYVVRVENDDGHIDGILNANPPSYTVELYVNGDIVKTNTQSIEEPTYQAFVEYEYAEYFEERYGAGTLDLEASTYTCENGTVYTFTKGEWPQETDGTILWTALGDGTTSDGKPLFSIARFYITDIKLANHSLTITKAVTGNMGDTNKDFAFTLTLKNGATPYTPAELTYTKNEQVGTVSAQSDGSYTFTMKDSGSITITVPAGYTYTVKEDKEDYTAAVTGGTLQNDDSVTGTLNANTTIAFTNTKNVNPPTGLTDNAAPYMVMVGIAAAGVSYVLVRRRRDSE